jgi:hypothetical protein
MGTSEVGNSDKDERAVNDVRALETILRDAKLGPARLRVVVTEGGMHNEATWAARFPDALEFLYSGHAV